MWSVKFTVKRQVLYSVLVVVGWRHALWIECPFENINNNKIPLTSKSMPLIF